MSDKSETPEDPEVEAHGLKEAAAGMSAAAMLAAGAGTAAAATHTAAKSSPANRAAPAQKSLKASKKSEPAMHKITKKTVDRWKVTKKDNSTRPDTFQKIDPM
jgi:hypothetical protein